jgi:RimJ/RimL family protein N-acetyltransferase
VTTSPATLLGPTLETPRLILRPPAVSDFDAFCAFAADEEVARYIGAVAAPHAVWRALMTMIGCWSAHGFAMFSVLEKSSGRWIGRLGPWRPWGWPGDEVGWGLVRDVWGMGYATEGSAAAIDWAVDILGWTDVIHCIDPANAPSQGVARRLGSTNRGPGKLPAPYENATIEIWGQTADEWRARRGAR